MVGVQGMAEQPQVKVYQPNQVARCRIGQRQLVNVSERTLDASDKNKDSGGVRRGWSEA